jgi:membrane protein DedA with SNARE-associated domain
VPFLFAAGALQYPIRKFLLALTPGRTIRFTLLAFLATRYGKSIIAFIAQHGHPGLLAIIGSLATAAVLFLYFVFGKRQRRA